MITTALLLSLLAAGGEDLDGRGPTAAPRTKDPQLERRDCGELPPEVTATVECHFLVVPMNRDEPDGETIRLAVAVIKSQAAQPEPDPVVYLEGGPGGSIVEFGVETFGVSPILEHRDVVLFDQRGTGLSEPALECPEHEDAVVRNLGRAESYETEFADYEHAYEQCRARVEDEGIDLDGFDTEATAADVADLRVALGADEVNLYGTSYGTRVALATMRSHPEGIRSAILDSVYPPGHGSVSDLAGNVDAALDRLFDACAADSYCSTTYPDLETTANAVIEQFNETPFEGTVDLGDPYGIVPLVITGDDLVAGLFLALYDTTLIPAVPSIITGLSGGDTSVIPLIASEGIPFINRMAEGIAVSVDCADNGALARKRDKKVVEDPGHLAGIVVYFAMAYCSTFDVESLPEDFNETVRSEIPALVTAGSLDPTTPVDNSEATADALENATYVEFGGYGHVVIFNNECGLALRAAFLDDPGGEIDTSCAQSFAPTFV